MTPSKITKEMADAAIKSGAKVTTPREIKRPKKTAPIPAAPDATIRALEQLVENMTQLHLVQLQVAQAQNEQLLAVVTALAEDKPVRLKPKRDMDRGSPTYLLMEYLDVVPVKFTQKLNS